MRVPFILGGVFALALAVAPQSAKAARTWSVNVGAETKDHAGQADAFLPNEIWINAGDSIQFTWKPQNEPHTVTLLKPGQTRPTPPPPFGPTSAPPPFYFSNACPSPNNGDGTADYYGTACVSTTGFQSGGIGSTFKVTFHSQGNYKFVCLIHTNMTGTVHVLDANAPLPYGMWDYERQARDEAEDILKDTDNPREEVRDFHRSDHEVLMTGEIAATAGGRQYLAIVRFFPETIYIHKGETVEFVNADPTEPHTVTSGTADTLASDMARVGVAQEADGALLGTVNTAADFADATATTGVNSGFLQAAPEDAAGNPQSPVFSIGPPQQVGLTRIRIKFNVAGTFYYHCALHDVDGMQGKVVVK
jgi:plastocyanin